MNIIVMTKGEWQAFGLVIEVLRQKDCVDTVLVWDDFSPEEYVNQMRAITDVKQHALNANFGAHRNAVKGNFKENDWILMLDADEWILPGFLRAINQYVKDNHMLDALFLERYNTFWDETRNPAPQAPTYTRPFRPDFQGRVFRNLEPIYYDAHVHEGLRGYQWPAYLTGNPFTIIHHKPRGADRYAALVTAIGSV